jgi:hypothetical protein
MARKLVGRVDNPLFQVGRGVGIALGNSIDLPLPAAQGGPRSDDLHRFRISAVRRGNSPL